MYNKRFDPERYWNNKPVCVICKKRKVVTGNICHECKEEGNWPNKYLNRTEIEMLTNENEIIINENSSTEEFKLAPPFVRDLIGYYHDCAQELLHNLPLVDIDSNETVYFPLKADKLKDAFSEGIKFNQKDGFTIYTELQKLEKELIIGFLFIQGNKKLTKDKALKINAPLLLIKAELQRSEDEFIVVINDDTINLNQTVLTKLMDDIPEEEIDIRLQELYQSIPLWPIENDSIDVFINTLQTVFPKALDKYPENYKFIDWEKEKNSTNTRSLQISSAVIISKKPEFEGTVVSELNQLQKEAVEGTSLDTLFTDEIDENYNNEFSSSSISGEPTIDKTQWLNVFPLPLSDAQQEIILGTRQSNLSVISGPPGTGKTYTIAAIVIDYILAGKKVLIASRMDKAIEVIVRFLEEAIDHNSIARSGAREQQRQLAKKVEKITTTSSKSSGNSRNTLIAQYNDLSLKINDFINAYENALRDERIWAESSKKFESLKSSLEDYMTSIELVPDLHKAESMYSKVKNADRILKEKSFFIQTFRGKLIINQLKKELNLPKETSISKLAKVIETIKESSLQNDLANKLNELDEINIIWKNIKKLQNHQNLIAKEIVRETISNHVNGVVHNHQLRKQLRDFLRSLELANPKQKLALLEKVNPNTLLETFGCWASTTPQISQILPLQSNLFDLVIFDESSQCDVATAIPVLYRARRSVIVGDPKQLQHFVLIGKQAEYASFSTHNIKPADQVKYRFSRKSLFDIAIDKVEQKYNFFLDEHYRSKPEIISFANDKFYGGNLRIMTQKPNYQNSSPVVSLEYVNGIRTIGSVNEKEIEQIYKDIREIIDNDSLINPKSIGIICPFRDQVNALQKAALKYLTIDEYEKHKIVIGTAHTLQGDEKDIMFLSLSIDIPSINRSLRFLETENVFNVAITRAKERLIVISSVRPKDLRMGLLKEFLEYIEKGFNKDEAIDKFDSEFEKDVTMQLRRKGLQVWTQFPSANFYIDLVVSDGLNAIAVECDGPYHDESQTQIVSDAERQRILERAGWQFVRIPYRLWKQKPDVMINNVISCLLEMS